LYSQQAHNSHYITEQVFLFRGYHMLAVVCVDYLVLFAR
jgi:hypothetical protein